MPDILIAENLRGAAVDVLRSRFDVTFMPELWKDPAKLLECIGDYRALLVRNQTDVNAAVIATGKKLVVIGRAGVGLDAVPWFRERDVAAVATDTPNFEVLPGEDPAVISPVHLAAIRDEVTARFAPLPGAQPLALADTAAAAAQAIVQDPDPVPH